MTVAQLLVHQSGFPSAPLNPASVPTREQRLERFASWRLNWEPGTRFEYHPTSAHWVLAELIEATSGVDYRTFVHTRVLDPLGLDRLRLGEPADRQGDILDLEVCGEPPTVAEFESMLGIPGLTLDQLVGEVTTDALMVFNRPAVRALGVPSHRTLGLMIAGDGATARFRGYGHTVSPRAFGHAGAGGQIAFADPDTGISFVYLTNGLDANILRESRRTAGLASRAGLLS